MSVYKMMQAADRAREKGLGQQAKSLYRLALAEKPGDPEAQLNYALSLMKDGSLEEALLHLDALAVHYQQVPAVAINRGEVLSRLGRHQQAVDTLKGFVDNRIRFSSARFNLALALEDAGHLEEAIAEYRRMLAFQPDHGEAWFNLGSALLESGQAEEAIGCFIQALERLPEARQAKVLNTLDRACAQLCSGDTDRAALQQALDDVSPQHDSGSSIPQSLERLGLFDEAEQHYRRLARQNPAEWWHELHADTLCPDVFPSTMAIRQWRDAFADSVAYWSWRPEVLPMDRLHLCGLEPASRMLYQGCNDRELKSDYAGMMASRLHTPDPPEKRSGADRLRIGIVVGRRQRAGFVRCFANLLPRLDMGRFQVTVAVHSACLPRLQRQLPVPGLGWLSLSEQVEVAAGQLRELNLDLLYHWQVGTDAFNYFLPWLRPAPVQYSSWAWPSTSGVAALDYFLSSDLVEPPGAHLAYSEALYALEGHLFHWAVPPVLRAGHPRRSDFGLSELDHLYLCPHQPQTIHPDFDALALDILKRDASAVILLMGSREGGAVSQLRQRLQDRLGALSERLIFVSDMSAGRYQALLQCVDVALDPPHFSSPEVSLNAFGLGLPIVTLRSSLMRASFTAGLYRQLGRTELVAENGAHYVRLAVALATDPEYRADWWQRLLDGRERLFYDDRVVTGMETAWQRMAGF